MANTKKAMHAFVALIALALIPVVLSVNDVYVYNNRMYVNNVEFIVKGVDYSPSPIGRNTMNPITGYGGTGFCSAKLTPWGEYRSACYDSDYFDGSPDIDTKRFPTGFAPLWLRDFPRIQEIGANTIRLYNANPSTRVATQTYTNLFPYATGKDHTAFMKLCEQYGFKVIFPLYSDNWAFYNTDEATYKRYLRWQVDEVGGSPALLMWQLGNEMDWTWQSNSNWNNADLMAKYNRYANYVRRYTKTRWNRVIPVTIAIVNQQSAFNFQVPAFHVDIFSANVFGDTFGNLFPGDGTSNYLGMTKLSCMYNKPFLITEFYRTWADHQGYPTGNINGIWKNVVDSIPLGLLGGVYFEQTDEPSLNKDFGAFALGVGYDANGCNSTAIDCIVADTITPKQQFYDLRDGTYAGKPYNMKTDIFSLLGRAATTLGNTRDPCAYVGRYRTCPGASLPKCSGNGVCDRTSGTCTCAEGWTGSMCQTAVCPGSPMCSNRGNCSTIVTPPECVCATGFYGPTCSSPTSSVPAGQCPNKCSGNGLCTTSTSTCVCWPGWQGADCAVHKL